MNLWCGDICLHWDTVIVSTTRDFQESQISCSPRRKLQFLFMVAIGMGMIVEVVMLISANQIGHIEGRRLNAQSNGIRIMLPRWKNKDGRSLCFGSAR